MPSPLRSAGAVEIGVVDQPLPADGGTRLLEVDLHHQQQPVLQFLRQTGQTSGIVEEPPSWIEQGPTTAISRPSAPPRMSATCSRARTTNAAPAREREVLPEVGRSDDRGQAPDAWVTVHSQ